MKKKRRSGIPRPSPQIQKTMDLTTGIVGLGVAGSVGATLPGLPGTIVTGGVMPIAATGLLGVAGRDYSRKRKR
jgi:hypothetical protein